MRNKSRNTGGGFFAIPLLLWAYFGICWVVNLIQLIQCDFAEPWRDEAIHAIGLMGPAAGITVWF